MNDSELDSKLKAARVPAREEDYWEAFPRRVAMKLRAVPPERPVQAAGLSWPAWGAVASLICLAAAFSPGQRGTTKEIARALIKDERAIRMELVQLPARLRTLMRDEHGLGSLITE
jgi:hypothetical protein